MKQYVLCELLSGHFSRSCIELSDFVAKIVDHCADVQAHSNEVERRREEDDKVHDAIGQLKNPINIEANDCTPS